jgi:hypothetical protein
MSNELTIAQALRRIKNLKGQIAEHSQRCTAGVSYPLDKVPAFRYHESLEAMSLAQAEMVDLEARVATANATATVLCGSETLTLTKAVRLLQELKGNIAFLKGLVLRSETVKTRTSDWDDDQMKNISRVEETTYVSDLSEQDRDKAVKKLQSSFEDLNNLVENANHKVMV